MAKKNETENSDQKVEDNQAVTTIEQTEQTPATEPVQKIGKYNKFEDIPEADRELLFNTIVDYSAQATSKSIQRDTAIFLIYDKFKELLG